MVENPATTLGRNVRQRLGNIVGVLALLWATIVAILGLRFKGFRVVGRVLMNQIRFTGVHAVGPVCIATLAIGALAIMQAATYLPGDYIVPVTTAVLIREIVPLLTALILIGRSGTAITIEIGNMKLNEELAALLKLAIPIEHFVFMPRFIGMIVSFLGLAIFADIAALVGGYYVARAANVTPITFTLDELLAGLQVADFFMQLAKVVIFGAIIALTSIHSGLAVRRSVREIPIVTTTGVVRSLIACLVLNTFISAYF